MEAESSSAAGPSSVPVDSAASSATPVVENGTAPAPQASSSEPNAAATATTEVEAPASGTAAPNGTASEQDNGDMSVDATTPTGLPTLPAHLTLEDPATVASSSTASSSNVTATTSTATTLPTPSTLEPPLSAPPAPSSSSEGRKAPRAAKVKANAMVVALGSDGLEGSLSASEGPGTPVMPNTAPLSRAKRQRNVKFR